MIKKRSSDILGVKMDIFSLKRHSEILVCEFFPRPPKLGARSPPMNGFKVIHVHVSIIDEIKEATWGFRGEQ